MINGPPLPELGDVEEVHLEVEAHEELAVRVADQPGNDLRSAVGVQLN